MFQVTKTDGAWFVRGAVFGLLVANLLATAITVWIIFEVRKEQVIFAEVMERSRHLLDPLDSSTKKLTYELRWQYGLTILVLLNIIATGLALAALARAYLLSQRSLRIVKELAANILASMDHAVITVDRQGLVNGINPKGQELLGLDSQDLGQPLSLLAEDVQPLVVLNNEVQSTGEVVRNRAFAYVQHGQTLRLMSHGHVLTDETGSVIGSVLHVADVTEQSLLQERMRRMERFLGLGSVAAGLAHEIKNPLSALLLHTQLLKEQLANTPLRNAEDTIDVLLSEVRRMTKVLDGFREFAAMDRLDRHKIELRSLLEKVVRLLRPQLDAKNISLHLDAERSQPLVSVDSVKIEQVLINLIINAIDVMPSGGTLAVRCWFDEDEAHVEVADSGPGIPPSIRENVFDPYVTTKQQGTGLGLAICEKIIRQHDGTISFEVSPQGTTFHLRLPRRPLTNADPLLDPLDAEKAARVID